jgi:hypothetical protein
VVDDGLDVDGVVVVVVFVLALLLLDAAMDDDLFVVGVVVAVADFVSMGAAGLTGGLAAGLDM